MSTFTAPPEIERPKRERARELEDRALISDLLHELFPEGLTDDAPIRKAKIVAAIRAGEL